MLRIEETEESRNERAAELAEYLAAVQGVEPVKACFVAMELQELLTRFEEWKRKK